MVFFGQSREDQVLAEESKLDGLIRVAHFDKRTNENAAVRSYCMNLFARACFVTFV